MPGPDCPARSGGSPIYPGSPFPAAPGMRLRLSLALTKTDPLESTTHFTRGKTMNTKPPLRILALAALLLLTINSWFSNANAQGTAFTYQGQLYAGTNLASGKYDFQFALSNAPSGGMQIGPTLTNLGVGVTNGLFIT